MVDYLDAQRKLGPVIESGGFRAAEERIDAMALSSDLKAGLWLWAWSQQPPAWQEREIARTLRWLAACDRGRGEAVAARN